MGFNLFLDDIRDPPDPSWRVARSVDVAKAITLLGIVDRMSLDHDLGACEHCLMLEYQNCRHVPTGYDFVMWMAEHGHWPTHKPVVHSANPVGRAAMIQAIDRYWVEP